MRVLGIGGSNHEFSFCYVEDGKILRVIEEERLSREKHGIGFKSMFGRGKGYCLNDFNINIEDIDLIVGNDLLSSYIIKPYKNKIKLFNHHLVHAASSYYTSGFEDSAVLVVDGSGSEVQPNIRETISFGYAKGKDISFFKQITGKISERGQILGKPYEDTNNATTSIENSLGDFYRIFTEFCGFEPLDAGKLMGLAPYGRDTYLDEIWKFVELKAPDDLVIHINNFDLDQFVLDITRGKQGDELFQIRADLAYAAQTIVEECTFVFLNHLYEMTQCPRLCLSGGVALNSVLNGKITVRTPFKEVYIQPAASDAGTAIGAALYGYYVLGNHDYAKESVMKTAYTGRNYTDDEIRECLRKYSNKINFIKSSYQEVIREAAKLICNGEIIGWFQGGSEIGPRALGHRSILADPRNPNMKDIINQRVKFRENFRPFAPAVLKEYTSEYFKMNYKESPFMLMVFDVLEEKKSVIPSVTHVDGTGRVQTVTKEDNDYYYDLIREFFKLTEVPVILNTSFNVKGEPIVETPEDAVKCFLKTEIDKLFIGEYIVKKVEGEEKYAK